MTPPDAGHEERPHDPQAIRSGDPRAFDRLYADLAPRVLGYLLRLTRNADRAAAEDLVQETFLAAYAGRAGFAARSRPLAWLLGIARRRWRDAGRVRRPTCVDIDAQAETLAAGDEGWGDRLGHAAELEQAMARLDPALREALELVVVQELTYKEAAAVLRAPVGTVKWRVHQATRALRCILSEHKNEEGAEEDRERRTEAAPTPPPDAQPHRAACGG